MKLTKAIIFLFMLAGLSCEEDPDINNMKYLPNRSAKADNGRTDRQDSIVWDFQWPARPGATEYYLYVKHANAAYPLLERGEITTNHYHYVSKGSYIAPPNYDNWTWKVKAKINDTWSEWSPTIYFSVEPVDTD